MKKIILLVAVVGLFAVSFPSCSEADEDFSEIVKNAEAGDADLTVQGGTIDEKPGSN